MTKTAKTKANNMVLRSLPSVDALLRTDFARKLRDQVGALKLTALARLAIENLRRDVLKSDSDKTALSPHDNGLQKQLLHRAEEKLKSLHDAHLNARLRRVINATGVVLHTNLGRAPLSEGALQAIADASGYCALEYDIGAGQRGHRGGLVENLLIDLTRAEAALVVNNCAAAALPVLPAFARGGETIVSRGELV